MDSRIVAIVLALLVLLTGFLIVRSINEGGGGIVDTRDNLACIAQGGVCRQACEPTESSLGDGLCTEGLTCCGNPD